MESIRGDMSMRKAKQVEQPLTGGVIDCCSDEYFTILHADDAWYHFIGYTKEEFADKFHKMCIRDSSTVMGHINFINSIINLFGLLLEDGLMFHFCFQS